MIGARWEPPSLFTLLARQQYMEQERLRRCLSLAEELELARLQRQVEQMQAVEALGWERMKAEVVR